MGRVAAVALVALGAAAVVSCNETTPPALRYPVLDDVGESDWQAVASGGDHTCALKSGGAAYCWGSNRYGQLGTAHSDTTCGTDNNKYPCNLVPHAVATTVSFVSVSAGSRHTCGITTLHEAYCWGANDQSQLGSFGGTGPNLVRVAGSLPWTQISAGDTHTCAVRSDGALFCWGQGDRGQLGVGSGGASSTPLRVQLSEPVASVSAGQSRTCARTTLGRVYCWGAIWLNREGGLEFSRSQATPQLVPGAPSMASLSVGAFTTCGTDISGFAYCWEANPRGEIGDGTTEGSTTPKRIDSDLEFVQVTSGVVNSCGITTAGTGYCWGDGSFGELGVNSASLGERCSEAALPCSTHPIAVIGRQAFSEISAGLGSHVCGVTTRGNIYCWGLGVSGQRGDNTMRSVSTPLTVVEPTQP